jgi:hemerythrin-like domain-containing protein
MSQQFQAAGPVSANHHHQLELSQRTSLEHDDLVECMHRLEAALASPAPGRETEWARRAASELKEVEASLRRHIASAEGEDGLFAELDLSAGTVPARVEQLRREHVALLEQAAHLAERLARADQSDFTTTRNQAEELLSAIRRHYTREVDLIFECFWLDIGVGD